MMSPTGRTSRWRPGTTNTAAAATADFFSGVALDEFTAAEAVAVPGPAALLMGVPLLSEAAPDSNAPGADAVPGAAVALASAADADTTADVGNTAVDAMEDSPSTIIAGGAVAAAVATLTAPVAVAEAAGESAALDTTGDIVHDLTSWYEPDESGVRVIVQVSIIVP